MIRVQNVYYMLAYAFQVLHEQGYKNVATEEFDNVAELLSAILCRGVSVQIKRGLIRQYISREEALASPRGKLEIGESIKTQVIRKKQLVCNYDEFSVDAYPNRIIKTTMDLLLRGSISKARKKEIRKLMIFFDGISILDIHSINWDIQYDRNNQTYRMLIAVCRFVIKGLLQTTADGSTKIMDYADDQTMAKLYEKFILGYYQREHPELKAYEEAWADEEYKTAVIEEALRDLGYVIEPQYLFRKMVRMVENRSFDIEFLQSAINALMESTIGNDSQEDFDGLFSDMQLDSSKLGHTVKDRSAVMAKIIASLDEINFGVDDTKIDVLGNAYEYLIGQFAATAGKKAGEFYTPSGPAELLCRLACLGLTDVKDAADPTCGSGSLLLRLKNYANVRNYYGQELTSTTYNLARMNMILRGIPYRNFNIYNGDTLEHDYFGDMKFRVQVANPPYSANWSADMHFMEDERFNEYGKLAPKSKADFAFVQHMVYHMDEDGRAVVLLPHGVLFRGAAEEAIRKHLIQKLNVLDAVIGLPANLFFGTGIPVCVLVLKRERNGNSDNILFIDASSNFEAGKNQNILRECDIDKIVETYERRQDVDKYAHVATMQEIEENGFNLNIPRYVDTFEPEPEIDLNEVAAEIRKLQSEIKDIDAELKPFFDELGLDFPFDVEGK